MRAEIISVGTELLLGEIVDTNSTHIARELRGIGTDLYYMTTVGDNEQRIAEAINQALNRSDIVIMTGGLGPTVDDVTREAIARATGHPLEFHQELLDQIADKFRRFGVKMSENNRRQAYVPQGAIAIDNPVGTAPIFILEMERGTIMTLPGVPREMKYLLEHELLPWLRTHTDSPAVIKSVVLRTAGIGESQIDAQIADLMTGANPTVGLAAHSGQTDIRITAKATTEEEADGLIAPVEADLRNRLGEWIYGTGDESIEQVVMRLLHGETSKLASIEAGTQGALQERLEDASGDSRALLAGSRTIKLEQLADRISADDNLKALAESMAQEALSEMQASYGLAVLIVTRADAGLSGTAVAATDGAKTISRYFEWTSEHRSDAHIWATTHALAMLRRMMLGRSER